jgi:hypothetical protein
MISFEAPTRERTSAWPSPAINLFLYDLREASAPRDRSFQERPAGISTVLQQAPMRLACTFAITVWTSEVRDEHQILSQVLSILLAYPTIPVERLTASLLVGEPAAGLTTRVGQAKEEGRADSSRWSDEESCATTRHPGHPQVTWLCVCQRSES